MQIETTMLPWITIASILIYIPVLCWLDWKYRDIKTHKLWLPLIAVNIPVVTAGYITGLYDPVLLFITTIFSLAWFGLLYRRGADCVFLICITMFAVINPVSGTNFIQGFLLYLVIFTAATYWGILLDNRLRKHIWSFDMTNGIPYLIPISCAFIAAVIM